MKTTLQKGFELFYETQDLGEELEIEVQYALDGVHAGYAKLRKSGAFLEVEHFFPKQFLQEQPGRGYGTLALGETICTLTRDLRLARDSMILHTETSDQGAGHLEAIGLSSAMNLGVYVDRICAYAARKYGFEIENPFD